MKLKKIKTLYEIACNEYIEKFVKKQGYEFDGWVAEEVGGLASFIEQYYFSLSDIIYDLETNQKKGEIMRWQEYGIERNYEDKDYSVNYKTYCKGFRYES